MSEVCWQSPEKTDWPEVDPWAFLMQSSRKMEQDAFICYGREDLDHAKRLFLDLRNAGLKPWLDQECLHAGQKWRVAIRRAIHQSRFFIALLSSKTAGRKGFLNTEIREALEVLREHSDSDTFLIPVRLDDCEMPQAELWELHRIDMFPDWDMGVKRILKGMAISQQPVTAFIAIQFGQLDPEIFARVFTSGSGREHTLPGYDKPRSTAESNPVLAFLLSSECVEQVHWVHGDFDVLAIVKTKTVVDACNILERIRRLPGVRNTSTTLSTGLYHATHMT